ncbi:glycosyltransferase family 2 protein [Flavobacterium hibisci]|uniref:glycosyltransferase family 2 protein n=1 Tax=Flavobacterium hibisci TaxID=1914462 RepID=UPI001CBD2AC8|nr:glycosyltransferase family 2 protein [Flavobacterium hibisci]MBZ4041950.1 glycosyltransferase family 2 protein [Flavobacterium hibisci]
MNPLISIIIPIYNRANLIEETLDSIVAQTYQNWECIIVDDGSTDNTFEIVNNYIKKDSRFQIHNRPIDKLPGGNAARNYGFELSRGEFINWFDSDDIMFPDKIERKVNLILKNEYDFVVCKGAIFESLPMIEAIPWPLHLEGNVLLNHILGKISFVTNGPLFKKDFLLKNKPLFNEKLTVRQEWEFFNRLLIESPKIAVCNDPLYFFRTLNSGIRNKHDFNKYKSRIVAERLTLINLKQKKLMFTTNEWYIYRKKIIRRNVDFYKTFPFAVKMRLLLYILTTILMSFDFNLIKTYITIKSQR